MSPRYYAIPPQDDTEGHGATPTEDAPTVPEEPGAAAAPKTHPAIAKNDEEDTEGHIRGR